MRKYEIMLILKGTLPQDAAKKVFEELKSSLTSSSNLNVTEHGVKKLAYPIKNEQTGYYYQINFDSDGKDVEEFRRLSNINSNILRAMIINLENDYGYKSISNIDKAKKIEQKMD